MNKLTEMMAICKINNRVCPQPQKWNKLWQLLKNKKRVGNGWIPSLPLILAAWHQSSDFSKRERFIEHLKWADEQNQIDEIFQFLITLDEIDWYHENE